MSLLTRILPVGPLAGLLMALILISACNPWPADPRNALAAAQERGTLRVGVAANPPWVELHDLRSPAGMESELIREFAAQQGLEVEWHAAGIEQQIEALKKVELDLLIGLFMLISSLSSLLRQEHPSIGHFQLFDWQYPIWAGWVMIAALLYSIIPPVILGRMKLPLARALHESTLYADASMNKADWITSAAAIVGVLGIGLGLWWADAVAAAVISVDVLRDGISHLRKAMLELMDQRPTEVVGDAPLGLEQTINERLMQEPDILDVETRLREEGHLVGGEIFVVFDRGQTDIPRRAQQLIKQSTALDWRLYDLIVMPVEKIQR